MKHYSWRVQPVKPIVKAKIKPKAKKKRKGYWKRYHQTTGTEKQDFALLREVCYEQGNPWQSGKRGPKPKLESWEYAAVHGLRRINGKAYRDVEKVSESLTGEFIDHSWVGKTLQRIPPLYLKQVINAFWGKVKALLAKQFSAYIEDATGISTDRYSYNEDETERKLICITWHVIIEYWYRLGLMCIVWCDSPNPATEPERESPTHQKMMVEGNIKGQGQIFPKDKGYDSKKVRQTDKEHGFKPIIPYREYEKTKHEKQPQLSVVEKLVYRFTRGIVEGIFGGTETEHGNKTRMRLTQTRQNDTILLGLKQNLQAYKQAIILILLNWRQPRPIRNI